MTDPTFPAAPEPTPYAAPVGAPAGGKTNTLAIVSLVLSIIGVHLGGIITGHIALGQIKRTGETGRGLALAGTIIGYVGLVLVVIGTILFFVGIALAANSDYSTYGY